MTAEDTTAHYYTVGITGAGGLVGTALQNELARRHTLQGHPVRVVRLQRGTSVGPINDKTNEAVWNPSGTTADEVMDPMTMAQLDAVVHLAGENVGTGLGPLGFLGLRPWSAEKKDRILNSRVDPTQALSRAIASSSSSSQNQKQPKVFLAASGVGAYGNHFVNDQVPAADDESTDTSAAPGFLAKVSRASEAAAAEAAQQQTTTTTTTTTRVVNLRFGVVLSRKGGALAKLFPVFFLGGGGRVGSGQQYFSFISARDLARAIVYTLETPSLKGPVNFTAPNPCTNAEFTKALGKTMGRPTIFPLPAFVVKAVFGEMGEEMLLGGVRALPSKLVKSGFEFKHPTIDEAVKSALEEEI